ncbi:MAG: hypothetical protein AB7U61_08355 [Methylocystis sp.]
MLRRLYKPVEDGLTDIDEMLADRLAALISDRDRARTDLERIKVQLAPELILDADRVERFGAFMRERITTGDPTFRKAHLRSIVDAIKVDDKVAAFTAQRPAWNRPLSPGNKSAGVFAVLYANGAP